MKIMLLSILMLAVVSATFCGDTKIHKTVTKKRELCPGSRSVEDILKELRCVEGTIQELTTALIKVHSVHNVEVPVTTAAAPPTTAPVEDKSLWERLKEAVGLGTPAPPTTTAPAKPVCPSAEEQLKHCPKADCLPGQVRLGGGVAVDEHGCRFYGCPSCQGTPCSPPPACAVPACLPGQTLSLGKTWTDSRGCFMAECPKCEGEPKCPDAPACPALECKAGSKPNLPPLVRDGRCEYVGCPTECVPETGSTCPPVAAKSCLVPTCAEDETLVPGRLVSRQSTGCDEFICPFCYKKACPVGGDVCLGIACAVGETRKEGFLEPSSSNGNCPKLNCHWCAAPATPTRTATAATAGTASKPPTAPNHVCPDKVFGNPAAECAEYGLAVLGKDDFEQKTASRDASLALVKAGLCYTLYPNVAAGTELKTWDGKTISHVTYCGIQK